MPKDFIHYIVMDEKIDLIQHALGILSDPNISEDWGTARVINIDIKYSKMRGSTYRLTYRDRRPSEVPRPNRGPGSRGGPGRRKKVEEPEAVASD